MHASIEQLLSIRDTAAVDAEVKLHVESCEVCESELERLETVRRELQALGQIEPPLNSWIEIEDRLREAADSRRTRTTSMPFYLAAGGFAAAIVVAFLMSIASKDHDIVTPVAEETNQTEHWDELKTLARRSQQLEQVLVALGDQPYVVRAGTADTIATLEDRIALVDYQLSYANAGLLPATQPETLWQERVDLMNSLVQVRYAEVQRVSY